MALRSTGSAYSPSYESTCINALDTLFVLLIDFAFGLLLFMFFRLEPYIVDHLYIISEHDHVALLLVAADPRSLRLVFN